MTKPLEKYENLISRLENKLDDNIKATNESIKSTNEKIDKILEILNDNQRELSRQHHDLYGNGKKGLFDEVEELRNSTNQRILSIKKDVDNNSKHIWSYRILAVFIASIYPVIEMVKKLIIDS